MRKRVILLAAAAIGLLGSWTYGTCWVQFSKICVASGGVAIYNEWYTAEPCHTTYLANIIATDDWRYEDADYVGQSGWDTIAGQGWDPCYGPAKVFNTCTGGYDYYSTDQARARGWYWNYAVEFPPVTPPNCGQTG